MPPARLLIIRFSALGDIVLTSPVTRALRRAFPETEIVFAAKRMYAPIAAMLPGVDAVLPFDATEGIWRLIDRIRQARFDAVIDLHANARSRLVTALAGAGQRIRYDKRRLARMRMVYRRKTSIPTRHTVDLYLDTLKSFDLPCADRLPSLVLSGPAHSAVAERLRGHGILPPDRLLGLAPGASSATKWWPARHFAQLADHTARTLGTRTLLIGSARDRDAVQAVRSAMTTPALDWTGTIDLSMLPAVIHRCAVLVSNDSGPMHVASAVRTPVIGLFGPTHPRLGFTPLGPQDAALTLDLACSPCSLHGNIPCRIGTHACLDTLPVSRVIREVAQRLARPEDRAQTMT